MTAPTIDLASVDASQLPAIFKGITLRNGGYEIGPGSALAPGSYSLIQNENDLGISVNLALKQFLASNSSAAQSFSYRQELAPNLYIIVLATTDRDLALEISDTPTKLLSYISNASYTSQDGRTMAHRLNMNDKMSNMANQSELGALSLSDYANVTGADIPFNTSFTFSDATNLNYLCLFAASFVDTNVDGNINIIAPEDVLLGSLSTELIIKEGRLHTESTLFYTEPTAADPSERLWIGQTHQMQDGRWMSGASHSNNSQYLTTKKVFNSKIADFRGVSRLERLKLNFDKISGLENISKQVKERLRLFDEKRNNSINYVSDVHYSKDENNNLKLFFSFDCLNAIKRNGLYSSFYTLPSDLMETCTLLSIQVIRRRVNRENYFNKLTGGDSPLRLYDDKVDVVGTPTRIQLGIAQENRVLSYTIPDTEMNDIIVGKYEYGIEVEMLDNTKDKLVNILTDAQTGLIYLTAELEAFLSQSLLKGNYDVATNRYTPKFLKIIKENYYAPDAQGNLVLTGPWTTAALKYISSLEMLFGQGVGGPTVSASLRSELLSIVDPLTSGPGGIQFFIKTLHNFITELKLVLGVSDRPNTSQLTADLTGGSNFSTKRRIFQIRQFFDSAFDADDLVELGLDFLNVGTNATVRPNNLKSLSYEAWFQVASVEAAKLNSTNISSSTTYLTPNFLYMPQQEPLNVYDAYLVNSLQAGDDIIGHDRRSPVSSSSANSTEMKIELAFSRLLESKITQNSPFNFSNTRAVIAQTPNNMSTQQILVAQVQSSIMNSNNCTVAMAEPTSPPPQMFVFDIAPMDLSSEAQDPTEPLDASIPLSPDSTFIVGAGEVPDANSGSVSQNAQLPNTVGSTANYEPTIMGASSLVSNYLIQTDFFNGRLGSPAPAFRSFTAGTYMTTLNTSITDYQESIQQQQIIADAQPNDISLNLVQSQGPGAAVVAGLATQATPSVAPQEAQFVQQAAAGKLNPAKTAIMALRYGFIYKVQYLSAYASGQYSAETLIKKPIWLDLNENVVRSAESGGKNLLCRLIKHETLLSEFKGLQIPIYNQYFIIGSSQEAQNPVSNPIVPIAAPSSDVLTSMFEYSDSVEFSNSYDTESFPGSVPDPLTDYLIEGDEFVALSFVPGVIDPATTVDTTVAASRIDLNVATPPPKRYGTAAAATPAPSEPADEGPTNYWHPSAQAFRHWYDEHVYVTGNSGPRMPRHMKGDGPFRPWPPPLIGLPPLYTVMMLHNGTGPAFQRRRDILSLFENQTGNSLPPIPRN